MSAKTKAPKSPTAPEWIHFDHSSPDDDTEVLIHAPECDPDVCIGYKDGSVWRNAHGEAVAVNHWMPLPLPPQA